MRLRTLLPLAALLAGGQPLRAQDDAGLRLDLNIPAQRLVVWDGDTPIKRYVVSVGLLGHDTPTGDFTVQRAEWNPWWRPPEREWARDDKVTPPGPNNPMGRVKLFFAPYYYLHGTPHERELGTPASHGCVRMRNADAIELATLLHRRANPTVPASAIPAILRSHGNTRWVSFRSTVPLVIRYDPVVVQGDSLRIYPDVYARRAIHTEAVYQALIAAGYDASSVDRAVVRDVIRAAAAKKGTYAVPLREAFGGLAAARTASTAGR